MRTQLLCLALGLTCFSLPLCAQKTAKFKAVDLAPAAYLQQIAQTQNPQILDLRIYADYMSRHLPGAVNIEPGTPTFLLDVEDQLSQSDTLFVCCRMGKTKDVVQLLHQRLGYKVVYNLKGGTLALEAWQDKQKKDKAKK